MKTPSRPAARPLDWTAVRSRMAAAIEQTEALLEAAQQDSEAQYEQRSPGVAVDVSAGQSEEQAVGLVIFVLADRQFALEIRYVCEIVSRARVSPLPGMPPHACGVYDLRGQLLPVFDLRGPLDLPQEARIADDWAIVCGQERPEFLILSEAAPEISTLPLEQIRAAEPAPGKPWHWATTKIGAVILDGRRLLDDRRFFLEDEQITASDETERTEFHESPTSE
ncbi:purine-binding chemotaxis protein CheW [Sinorhizobium meliloti]|uniref:chemotaxis protein CheW n=1 Tax=Rhizobium meliloti TaxID=382 RepID=UPI0002D26A5F|nr:chemotaxis protein CheW [Sinorhizobium meliloti]ASP87545.1 chemotaxis protein CheW [Sinorhizobium meliloti]ATA95594.1 chemotaxis protein CheW [Sinorhizobium meliloti]ATB01290.1 chemotaxis protein CheW [Sinorhizobium meliloti]MDE3876706.1 purine-binding chemotaxis protein CheW [Sinorhizobium meliloti]MQW24774.1 chemotaxis protein CheW [Sinorhizobium meliloti]